MAEGRFAARPGGWGVEVWFYPNEDDDFHEIVVIDHRNWSKVRAAVALDPTAGLKEARKNVDIESLKRDNRILLDVIERLLSNVR